MTEFNVASLFTPAILESLLERGAEDLAAAAAGLAGFHPEATVEGIVAHVEGIREARALESAREGIRTRIAAFKANKAVIALVTDSAAVGLEIRLSLDSETGEVVASPIGQGRTGGTAGRPRSGIQLGKVSSKDLRAFGVAHGVQDSVTALLGRTDSVNPSTVPGNPLGLSEKTRYNASQAAKALAKLHPELTDSLVSAFPA